MDLRRKRGKLRADVLTDLLVREYSRSDSKSLDWGIPIPLVPIVFSRTAEAVGTVTLIRSWIVVGCSRLLSVDSPARQGPGRPAGHHRQQRRGR